MSDIKHLSAADVKKIYGRGYYDGCRAGEKDAMNAARMEAARESLNGIARKIYDFVPEDHVARPHAIMHHMFNKIGAKPELNVVQGSLATMVEKGLVKEPARGVFIRIPMREMPARVVPINQAAAKPPEQTMPAAVKPPPETEPTAPTGALEKLSAIAARVRESGKLLTALADAIDDAALEIDRDSEKFNQLKQLLKSIGQ